MTTEFWVLLFGYFYVLWRLERLGKQLEAVSVEIREELVPDPDRKEEIIREWKDDQKQSRKETRHVLLLWGAIAAAFLAWKFLTQT